MNVPEEISYLLYLLLCLIVFLSTILSKPSALPDIPVKSMELRHALLARV
jgi:hypothetical protein